jgi:hypothetical protein
MSLPQLGLYSTVIKNRPQAGVPQTQMASWKAVEKREGAREFGYQKRNTGSPGRLSARVNVEREKRSAVIKLRKSARDEVFRAAWTGRRFDRQKLTPG